MITEAEKVICRLYLEDMDKNHTCNEYRLLMELLDKEPCEDAISRQLAIDTAIDAVDSWDGGCNKEREKIIREALEKLPPAQPEQKIGYWIPVHPLQADDEGAYLCSNCNTADWDTKPEDKYCKFCGAKMLGVKKYDK